MFQQRISITWYVTIVHGKQTGSKLTMVKWNHNQTISGVAYACFRLLTIILDQVGTVKKRRPASSKQELFKGLNIAIFQPLKPHRNQQNQSKKIFHDTSNHVLPLDKIKPQKTLMALHTSSSHSYSLMKFAHLQLVAPSTTDYTILFLKI